MNEIDIRLSMVIGSNAVRKVCLRHLVARAILQPIKTCSNSCKTHKEKQDFSLSEEQDSMILARLDQ